MTFSFGSVSLIDNVDVFVFRAVLTAIRNVSFLDMVDAMVN